MAELRAHRDKYGRHEYTPGNNGSDTSTMSKAAVSALISEQLDKTSKEAEKQSAFKNAIIDELRGVITTQIAAASGTSGTKRTLQRAGTNANVGSAEAESQDTAAERCVASLMVKFHSVGTKAGPKSG